MHQAVRCLWLNIPACVWYQFCKHGLVQVLGARSSNANGRGLVYDQLGFSRLDR